MDEYTFWSSVKREGECLVWTRGTSLGYGYCLFDGKYGAAHRVAWRLATGRWPANVLHHTCGNRPCVNVKHLQEVTKKEHAYIHFGSKTHCPHGHPYAGENLVFHPTNGGRECRECRRKKMREYMRKKADERRAIRGPLLPRTHCSHGHEYTPSNTRLEHRTNRKNPIRICLSCERERGLRRRI